MRKNDAPMLLDATRLIWRRWEGLRATGIDRICLAWLDHYAESSQAVIVQRLGQTILPMETSQALFRLLREPAFPSDHQVGFRAGLAKLALRRGWHLARRLPGRGRLWLNPGHTGLNLPRVHEWVKQADVRPIYLVHDLIPITHPQYCRPGEDARHRSRMHTVLKTASGVVANSEDTLANLDAFARTQNKPLPRAVVAWPGTSELPKLSFTNNHEPSFVVIGTIEGRKNHLLLLKIWRELVRTMGQKAPKLLIVGRRGWQAEEVFDLLDTTDFAGRVVELGALDDVRLGQVLASARALLFPSFAEGFGIPLIEALTMGVPVIASDLPVFAEIGQGIPELVATDDQHRWTCTILDYAEATSPRRVAQLARLSAFQPPDWRSHFSKVDDFLRNFCNINTLTQKKFSP